MEALSVRKRTAACVASVVMAAGTLVACTAGGGVPGGPSTPPGMVQHKQVIYPAVNVRGGSNGDMGMANTAVASAEKPCTDCYLVGFRAGLIDSSGNQVNVREGYWLHHMVLLNTSNPGLACGVGDSFFSSGNERMAIDLRKSGNYGYPVRRSDRWSLIEELANLTTTAKPMAVTVDYDYVPMNTPGIRTATPLWIGAAGCVGSYIPPVQGRHSYNWTWTTTVSAKVLYFHMHTHDGGTDGTLSKNGQVFCDSTQYYGTTPDSIEGPGTMMPGMPHISAVHQCQGTADQPIGQFRRGDKITSTVNYDSNEHPLMGTEPLMGIGIAWLDTSTN
jgi:hypothetical protein